MSPFQNYFNYFTEIEEHFQRARGTSLFLLSPLDWALIETWKNSGIPLEAVLRGVDAAFEKQRSRRSKTQKVNSLAFCAQAVLVEAQRAPGSEPPREADAAFEASELSAFFQKNLSELRERPGFEEIAAALEQLGSEPFGDMEALEERLGVLEQRMIATARTRESDEETLRSRRELEAQLKPYKNKMSAPQLAMLERQFLERKLLERARLPRLSLFYLR